MTQKSTPDLDHTPKGRLARHMRLIRQRAGFTTQQPLATIMGVSVDLISLIERGKHVPPHDVFLAWIDACKVSEEARVYLSELWELARDSSGVVREFFEKYFLAAQQAAFLYTWSLLVIPGALQTRDYANAMFVLGGLDEDEAAEQTDLRMKLRARVDGPDPAHVTALIHERALYFRVGTPETMIDQLTDLLELSRRRNVVLQVVPDDGYFPGATGPFDIASGPDIADTVNMVTVEDQVSDEPKMVGKVIALFQQIHGYASSVAESRALLVEAIEFWKSQQQ